MKRVPCLLDDARDLCILQLGDARQEGGIELAFLHRPLNHLKLHRERVLGCPRPKGQQLLAERMREHGGVATCAVDRLRHLQRPLVSLRPNGNFGGDVGNGDEHAVATIHFFDPDGVVDIPGGRSVYGETFDMYSHGSTLLCDPLP